MARALGVSRSGFHGRLAGGGPKDPWARLREAVWRVWLGSDRTLGARLVPASPPDGSANTTPHRVRRRMRGLRARGIAPSPREGTTIPDKGAPALPDPARRDLTGPVPTHRPVGNVTCLGTREGWPCLATVAGPCARMVVGRAILGRMGADIVAGAPESDMCGLRGWQTREEARNAAARLIECRHDRHRPHPTIDDEVPGEVTDASLGGARPVRTVIGQRECVGRMAA